MWKRPFETHFYPDLSPVIYHLHKTPHVLRGGWCLAGLLVLQGLTGALPSPASPSLGFSGEQGNHRYLTFPPPPDLPLLKEKLSEDRLSDPDFGKIRWSCIIKGALWARRQSRSTPPAHAQSLIPQLKRHFLANGLPPQLAWMAEVESTLDTNAVSLSGARGLFQFKIEAAHRFGLLKGLNDLRSEPDKSAQAAALYLAHLHEQFHDWPLALAAYNAGEGCVGRLLKKNGARLYEAIAAELPPQTQVYVIKIMTILALRENTQLSALPPPSKAIINPSAN